MSKHTPGPWEVLDYRRSSPKVYSSRYFGGHGGPRKIADVYVPDRPHSNIYANAHLIAAAPELLAACKLAVETINDDSPGSGTTERDLLHQLHAAIAKATGGRDA